MFTVTCVSQLGDTHLSEPHECDNYKYEVHPATGLLTVTLYEVVSGVQRVTGIISSVRQIKVERRG